MNDYQALPRLQARLLGLALDTSPVVVVTGARQTGKTTLVRDLLEDPGRRYLTLDDLEILSRAREEPDALLKTAPRVTIDEVQRSPDLLVAIKRIVDEVRMPGQFILTGSSDLRLMQRVSESLAGRVVHVPLWPLTRLEAHGRADCGPWRSLVEGAPTDWPGILDDADAPRGDWREAVRRGGYPTPALHLPDAEKRELWHAGYTQTYLERDLRELSSVSSLADFRRLMRAACLRLGNLVNQTELGRDVGLAQPTVRRHLDLLETSFQLVRLPTYSVNRTKRLIKTPRLFWSDSAQAMHLSGETEPRGTHLENLVLLDLLAWRDSTPDRPQILYWRTSTQIEVDLVVEWRGKLLPIEVKTSSRARLRDTTGLRAFREEYADVACPGLLLHGGEETEWIAEDVLAAPWWRLV